jgi:hypothetical protein
MPIATLRRAGVPSVGFDRLALRDTIELIDHYLRLEAKSVAQRDRVLVMLEALIGPHKATSVGRELIKLRRNVYNDRVQPAITAAAQAVLTESVAAKESAALHEWIVDRSRREELRAAIRQAYSREQLESKHALWRLVGHRDFRNALAMASNTLSAQLERHLGKERREIRGATRAEAPLASYLSRSALKLSPFSSFTRSVPLFLTSEHNQELGYPRNERPVVVRKLTMNRSFVMSLARCFANEPVLGLHVPVYLTSVSRRSTGDVCTLRRRYDSLVAKRCAVPNESLVTSRDSASTRSFLSALEARGGAVPLGDALELLGDDVLPSRRLPMIKKLIEAGRLRHEISVEDQNSSGLETLTKFLRAVPGELALQLGADLALLAGALQRLQEAKPSARLAILGQMNAVARRTFETIGVSPPPEWDGILVFEDCAEVPRRLTVPDAWDTSVADLGRFVRDVAPLFDYGVIARETTQHVLRTEFAGRPVPLLDFLKCLSERASASPDRPFDFTNPLGLSRLAALTRARDQLIEAIATPSSDPAIDLAEIAERLELAQLVAEIGDHPRVACHVQPTLRDAIPHLVLNSMHAGSPRSFIRACHALSERPEHAERALGALHRALAEESREGSPCEIVAPFDFNANLHPPATEWTIDYCEVGPQANAKAFRVAELTLGLQADRIVLTHAPSGRVLAPCYLGALPPHLTPIALRFIACLGGSAPWVEKPFHLPIWNRGLDTEPVREHPALIFGRCVIRRKSWVVRPDAWPRRELGEDVAALAMKVRRWQRSIGMPNEVFVFHKSAKYARRKPEYLSLISPVFMEAFERRSIEGPHSLYIEEMCPTRASLRALRLSRPVEFVVDFRSALSADAGDRPPERR